MQEAAYTDAQVWDFVQFCMKLVKTGRRTVRAVLDQCPSCHFFALERLDGAIKKYGRDDAIYMGDLAAALHDSPQAVSRAIRILELDGLAERAPDPADRRKTLVRLTPLGHERRRVCEDALRLHMRQVWQRLGPAHTAALLAEARLLEQALAETMPQEPPAPSAMPAASAPSAVPSAAPSAAPAAPAAAAPPARHAPRRRAARPLHPKTRRNPE